jgi:CDP-diacylglycerol--glycerol-3-phosphate 3-phosphatidyltransferase
MIWNIPNKLTVGRLLLALVFFVLLGLYEPMASWGRWLMLAALVLYVISGLTDVADGHIARHYNMTTAFGRIMDPFVDKVLVVGTFVMLAGSNFALPAGALERRLGVPGWLSGGMASSVQAWMVVAILAREFAVSAVRGYSESQGLKFPATSAGKIKMFVQSTAICTVLVQLGFLREAAWAVWFKIIMVWLAVVVTVLSGLAYASKTGKLLSRDEND